MNQKDLIYIKTIADEGSISQAAKTLYLSQPSLSQTVKRIEDSLGVSLFKRTPRGLFLTEEGKEYYRMASKILNIYHTFETKLQNFQDLKTGSVTVGTTTHRGLFLLPEFLAQFYLKYPGITVSVIETSTDELEEFLLSGKIDFAFMRAPASPKPSPNLSYNGLVRASFLILLPPGHPAGIHARSIKGAPYPVLDPIWLADENFLLPDPSTRLWETVQAILKKAGILSPKSTYSSIYPETLACLTSAGQGISIVPQNFSSSPLKLTAERYSIPEEYSAFWEICSVTVKDMELSRAALLFIKEFSRHLGL